MQEANEFSLGLAYTSGAWERDVDFGVGWVAMEVMDTEKRRDCGQREERCGHRIEFRKYQCPKSQWKKKN